jgi:hypothetical protein
MILLYATLSPDMMTNTFMLILGGIMPKKTKVTETTKPEEIETAYKECNSKKSEVAVCYDNLQKGIEGLYVDSHPRK